VFLVISVYFNLRNILPKSGTFPPGHPVYINKEINKYRTSHNKNLHLPIINLSKFNKGAYFSGIQVFNHLPEYIKNVSNNQKCCTSTLKRFLYQHSFSSIEEYFKYKENRKYKKLCFLYSKCVNINTFLKSYYYIRIYLFCCISPLMYCKSLEKYP